MNRYTDYSQMLLMESLNIEEASIFETSQLLEDEAAYILNAMENNVCMEKTVTNTANNKGGIFRQLADLIGRIFAAFKAKTQDILVKLTPMKGVLDAVDTMDYTNLNIEAFPHWKVGADDIINWTTEFVNAVSNANASDAERYPDTDTLFKSKQPFSRYGNDDSGYKRAIRQRFSTGDNNGDYAKTKITDGAEVKRIAIIMRNYIEKYAETSEKLSNLSNTLTKKIEESAKAAEKATPTGESFFLIENAYASSTELVFCKNFSTIFEAEGGNQSSDDKQKESPASASVTSDAPKNNEGDNSDKDGNAEQNKPAGDDPETKYRKMVAKVAVDVMAIAITVAEEKLHLYKYILKALAQNAPKTNSNAVDVSSGKTKEEDNKKNKKSLRQRIGDKIAGNNKKGTKESAFF